MRGKEKNNKKRISVTDSYRGRRLIVLSSSQPSNYFNSNKTRKIKKKTNINLGRNKRKVSITFLKISIIKNHCIYTNKI